MNDYPTGLLPGPTMRALHSAWVDHLLRVDIADAFREGLWTRCQGATFRHLIHALTDRRMVVTHRTADDGQLILGLGVPAQSAPLILFELPESQHGMSEAEFIGMHVADLDAELADVLNSNDGSEEA